MNSICIKLVPIYIKRVVQH